MKVYLPITNSRGGYNLFLKRLAAGLVRLGVQIVKNPRVKHDVSVFPAILKGTNSQRQVLRLDSVYHDIATNYKARNRPIQSGFHRADAVVYQGRFSKDMCDEYLGKTDKQYTLIGNGVPLSFYDNVVPAKKEHKYVFLTASRWRPQKRLVDMMESFLLANVKDSVLYVAGDVFKNTVPMNVLKKYFAEPSIRYLGYISQKRLASYLKIADGFLHLSWFDCCPNGVVEAIAAKVLVITNNVGGTKELVGPSGGLVLPIDKPYDLKPCRLYEPPKIDRSIVAKAILDCCTKCFKINNTSVDINHVAKKYRDFFLGIL